jgi:hypothetical protein
MTALRITAILDAPVISYHGLHLDGILAHAVVERETAGAMLPQSPDYISIELPLRCLWRSVAGIPLWASTDLLPEGAFTQDTIWLHRRTLEPAMTIVNLHTGKGRYKERRSPLPALATDQLVAYVDGDISEIRELLSRISSIGKKRIVSGAVREWRVEEWTQFSLVDDAGRALRPIPHLYLYGEERSNGLLLAYSPPYWHVATRAMCVPTGSLC